MFIVRRYQEIHVRPLLHLRGVHRLRPPCCAIKASAAYADSAGLSDKERRRWRRPKEMVARAYAQYVAWRSGSIRLRRQMDRALNSSVLRRAACSSGTTTTSGRSPSQWINCSRTQDG